ncbi:MAG: V-type ATPase subunit [Candidatus Baldrarchaeia archaeon]
MSSTKYAFINAKIRGMIGKLLTKTDIDSLIGADSFQTVVRLLEQSSYGPRLADLPFEEITSENLDKIFSEDFVHAFSIIHMSSPFYIREFLNRVCLKFEARTLKTIIRAKAANIEAEKAMRYLIPVGRFSRHVCEELLKESPSNILETF